MLNKLVLMYCARPPSDKGAPKKETTWNDRHRAALGLSGNGSPKNLMAVSPGGHGRLGCDGCAGWHHTKL